MTPLLVFKSVSIDVFLYIVSYSRFLILVGFKRELPDQFT